MEKVILRSQLKNYCLNCRTEVLHPILIATFVFQS